MTVEPEVLQAEIRELISGRGTARSASTSYSCIRFETHRVRQSNRMTSYLTFNSSIFSATFRDSSIQSQSGPRSALCHAILSSISESRACAVAREHLLLP